jgi:hypothetical protein
MLDMSYCNVGPKGAIALASSLPSVPQLTTLCLDNCRLGVGRPAGSTGTLMDALAECTRVKTLHLHGNKFGTRDAVSLTSLLRRLSNLHDLDVGDNPLGDTGATTLTASLPLLPRLVRLDVSKCDFSSAALITLAGGLAIMTPLEEVSVSKNDLSHGAVRSVCGALLSSSTTLSSLDLLGMALDAAGLAMIGRFMAHFSRLELETGYDLSNNEWMKRACSSLATASTCTSGKEWMDSLQGYVSELASDYYLDTWKLGMCPSGNIPCPASLTNIEAAASSVFDRCPRYMQSSAGSVLCLAAWLQEAAWLRRSCLIAQYAAAWQR